jgi:hypothetical protein
VSNRYEVDLTRHAEKDLKALRAWNAAIFRHLARLETNPEAGHLLKGALHGCRSLELNLKGSGAYRAVYVIAPDEQSMHRIPHRTSREHLPGGGTASPGARQIRRNPRS